MNIIYGVNIIKNSDIDGASFESITKLNFLSLFFVKCNNDNKRCYYKYKDGKVDKN